MVDDKVPNFDLTEKELAPHYEEIKGKKYFRFSGKIDTIHLTGENNKLICGKPGLSNNYARYKPQGKFCDKCLEGIK